MRWYSVNTYKIPANIGIVFIALSVDELCVYKLSKYTYDARTDAFRWFDENDNTFSQVTHFCIPDPIEIEE